MKRIIIVGLIASAFILNGCFIKSLHPFYKKEDVVLKPELYGTWIDGDSAVWEIEQYLISQVMSQNTIKTKAYLTSHTDQEGKKSYFQATLFQLEGNYFVDFFPLFDKQFDDELFVYHMIPAHCVARFEQKNTNQFELQWMDEGMLDKLFTEKRIRIQHEQIKMFEEPNNDEDYNAFVLTASTDELQKFLKKFGNDPELIKKSKEDFADFRFTLTRQ